MEVIMTFIDTDEKLDWLLEALENNEIQIVSREWTEEEKKQLSRDIAICKALHKEKLAKEAVLA
jgi:hypothetical protein